jgi:acyl-CoA thioesterase-1
MRRKLPTLFLSALIPFLGGCSPGPPEAGAAPEASRADGAGASGAPAARPEPPTAPAPDAGRGPLVVFLGDSLSAGQGLEAEDAFPAVLGRELQAEGRAVRIVNAGVSGDTTAGGLARLPWVLRQKPDIVVVELGANDGLRALSLTEMEKNLRQIVEKSSAAGAEVLLVGMQIPPNYGPAYSEGFAATYPRLAKELGVPLVPFLLAGVGGDAVLNQSDGIHPTAEGHRKLAATVRPFLEKMIQR